MSVELAHRLADIAAGVALPYFARGVVEETNDDCTPVSEVDFATDAALIDEIRRERGSNAASPSTSRRRWSLWTQERWTLWPTATLGGV